MHKGLRWALGLTIALTAAALMRPARPPTVVGAVDSVDDRRSDAAPRSGDSDPALASGNVVAWPERLEPWVLDNAKADIFSAAPTAPAVPASVGPPPAPAMAPPPPAPAPASPPLAWRYLGRMVTPGGATVVLLSRADGAAVSIQQGSKLDDGYEVLAILPDAVRLVFPPTGVEVDVPIPAAASGR